MALEETPPAPEEIRRLAAQWEEEGRLAEAAEAYRALMAAAGPDPETCFQLAEILYRLGDLAGARERYYMAIELDEDYVEARANLGCVLAETGQPELAVAALEGALRYHGGYADVHYHLARTLDELGRGGQAEGHWRTFLAITPNSPWAEEARVRLGALPDCAAQQPAIDPIRHIGPIGLMGTSQASSSPFRLPPFPFRLPPSTFDYFAGYWNNCAWSGSRPWTDRQTTRLPRRGALCGCAAATCCGPRWPIPAAWS